MRLQTLLFVIPVALAGCTSTSAEAQRRSIQVQYPVQQYLEEIASNVASARTEHVVWDGAYGVHPTAHEAVPPADQRRVATYTPQQPAAARPPAPPRPSYSGTSSSHGGSVAAQRWPTRAPRSTSYQPSPPHTASGAARSSTPLPPTTYGSYPSTQPPRREFVDEPRAGTGLARRRTTYDESRNAKHRD